MSGTNLIYSKMFFFFASHSPSQSWILDINDDNWNNVFSSEERKEMYQCGRPLLPPMDETIQEQLNELEKLVREIVCWPGCPKF